MPGVRSVTIDFDNSEARVNFDANKATLEAMGAALEKIGFKGSLKSWPNA